MAAPGVIGQIDLGTTNSCVAAMEGKGRQGDRERRRKMRTTPSIVAFTKRAARSWSDRRRSARRVTNPENTIFANQSG